MQLFEPFERSSARGLFFLVGIIGPVIVWACLANSGVVPSLFLPGGREILRQLAAGPEFSVWLSDLFWSSARILAGFCAAMLVGIPVGLYLGGTAKLDTILSPVIEMGRFAPVPALLPLCILWFGIGELEKIAVIFLGTFFQTTAAVASIVKATPVRFVDTARTLGMSNSAILWRVALPAAWPSVFETIRISFGWAWSYLVVAEIVAARAGVGYRIMWSQRYLQVGIVFVCIAELAMLGLLSDFLFRLLRPVCVPWEK